MKSVVRIAIPVVGAVLICGAAVSCHLVKARATDRKLVDDANACRVRAEQGNAKAQYNLARLYYQGKGVPQDYSKAFTWYRKAADQGNPKAQYGVGFMYDWGKGVPQDYTQAASWYHRAADQGNANAQYRLASMYHEGSGIPQDFAKALDWWRKAADQGYAKAEYALGYTYFVGKEIPQDYTEAARWYRKAADQGYAEAQTDLGYMYSQGKGVPADYTEAVAWYRKAADQRYARAQDSLGYSYYEGKGVPRDYVEAARWYRKAAKQGDEYGRRALDSMKIGFSLPTKINMSVVFLGGILLLISSRGSIRNRQQRKVTLAALFFVLWVGLTVYGYSHFGILLSLSAVNAFYFGKGLLSGIGIVMLLSFFWPQPLKVALGICGILFTAVNFYGTMHFGLRYFALCPRAFYSSNGLLIGMAITLATLLWLERKNTRENQNGNDSIVHRTVPGSGSEPAHI